MRRCVITVLLAVLLTGCDTKIVQNTPTQADNTVYTRERARNSLFGDSGRKYHRQRDSRCDNFRKEKYAEKNGVSLVTEGSLKGLSIGVVTLCTVLSNLLDNAVEAAAQTAAVTDWD